MYIVNDHNALTVFWLAHGTMKHSSRSYHFFLFTGKGDPFLCKNEPSVFFKNMKISAQTYLKPSFVTFSLLFAMNFRRNHEKKNTTFVSYIARISSTNYSIHYSIMRIIRWNYFLWVFCSKETDILFFKTVCREGTGPLSVWGWCFFKACIRTSEIQMILFYYLESS